MSYPSRRETLTGTGWGLLALLGLLVLIVAGFVIQWIWAPFGGALQERQLTVGNGYYRIAAYDSFYDQCGSIQAIEDQITNVKGTPIHDGFSKSQKVAILLALQNQRATAIRQYNADAQKADTKAHFLASNLPFQIDPTQENTTCAA